MKRLLYFFILAITVAFASCTKDNTVTPDVEETFNVSFSVTPVMDETDPQATRAYNAGENIKALHYAIYKKNSNGTYTFVKSVADNDFFVSGTSENVFNENLAYGKTYVLLLWADSDEGHYTVTWNQSDITASKVAITDTAALTSQDDSADAFFAKVEMVANEDNQTTEISLRRPFAQVNVGTTTSDYNTAVSKGFTATSTSMKINAYTSMNLFEGTVGDKKEVTFAFAPIPTGDDATLEVNGTSYKRLAMNYLFAPATSENVDITFYANSTANLLTWSGLQLMRNMRTNICGSILSNNSNWHVYYTEIDVKVMTWNVCNNYPYVDENWKNHEWKIRRAALADLIKKSGADVIFLQELNCTSGVKFFRDIMQLLNGIEPSVLGGITGDSNHNDSTWPIETYDGSTYYGLMIKRGTAYASNSSDEGNAVIYKKSKFEETKSGYFWLSGTPDKESIYNIDGYKAKHQRICVFKRLEHTDSGKELVVASTHIDNSHENALGPEYVVMTSQIQILINNLRARALTDNEQRKYEATAEADKVGRCPIIVGGDMNATPTTKPIQRFGWNIAYGYRTTATGDGTKDNDFADCYAATPAASRKYPDSSTSNRGTMATISGTTATRNTTAFDYLFMRWGNSVKEFQIYAPTYTFTYDGKERKDVLLSDHCPVTAVINLRYYE